MEHERAAAPAEVVDHVEGTCASVQRRREPAAVSVWEPPEHANARKQPPHDEVAEDHVPQHLAVRPSGPVGAATKVGCRRLRNEVVKVEPYAFQLCVDRLPVETLWHHESVARSQDAGVETSAHAAMSACSEVISPLPPPPPLLPPPSPPPSFPPPPLSSPPPPPSSSSPLPSLPLPPSPPPHPPPSPPLPSLLPSPLSSSIPSPPPPSLSSPPPPPPLPPFPSLSQGAFSGQWVRVSFTRRTIPSRPGRAARLRRMTEYQVTRWRELPSMVAARAGDDS